MMLDISPRPRADGFRDASHRCACSRAAIAGRQVVARDRVTLVMGH